MVEDRIPRRPTGGPLEALAEQAGAEELGFDGEALFQAERGERDVE